MGQGGTAQLGRSSVSQTRYYRLNPIIGMPDDFPIDGMLEKLEMIRSCDYVITDTYHCAVNSWREGVPAVCVGNGNVFGQSSLDEKKKELLFMSINAQEYYLFFHNIITPGGFKRSVKKMANLLRDQPKINLIGDFLKKRKAKIIRSFKKRLDLT